MEPESASPKKDIDQILDEIQTKFKERFSGESKIENIVEEIKKSDVKALVILKQQLRNVLTDMENLDAKPSSKHGRKPSLFGGSSSRNLPKDTQKKKVMEDLERIAQKAKYLTMVGREKEKEEIIDQLMLLSRSGDGASPVVPVITISGLAGIGKTILAELACQDEKVKKHVGLPVLVSGADYNTFDADSIADKVTTTAPSRTENLNRIVILDDWRVEIEDKDVKALQDKLLEKARLCVTAIVITTRSCLVAMARKVAASPVKSYALAGLNEEEIFSLFQKILKRRDAGDHSSITEDVRTMIAEKCRGVPRAIEIMADLLYSGPSLSTEFTEEDFLRQLVCSYYDEGLPEEKKLCFAYCSLFPQDYLFDAERLIHLWMAEGFLNKTSNPSTSSGSEQGPEDIGREYLRDLVGRSIFQDVKEDEFGHVRSCRMHPLMHDIATFVADRENITVDPEGHQVRRASFDLSLLDSSHGIPAPLQLRSILLSRLPLQVDKSTKVLKNIFKNFKMLCVLDLRNLGIEAVPSSIGELKHLEYLDLSHNGMKKLPSSIAKLCNLQTLKLSGCHSLEELPNDFKNLAQLKHLDMVGCFELTGMPPKMSKLTSLQTLSTFVASKNGGLEELAMLKELRGHLEIWHLDRVKSLGKRETEYLEEKKNLQRLTLRWNLGVDQEEGQRHLSLLECLKLPSALRVLILEGYRGGSLSSWLTSIKFTGLVKLRLEDCPRCKYLSQQDQLPKLKILQLLRLENLEYIAQNCDKKGDFYKNLEELTIEDCPKLKSWWQAEIEVNERPFFASISKLHVHHCPQLTHMPLYPRLDMVLEGSSSFGKEMVLKDSSLKLLLDTISYGTGAQGFSKNAIPLENLHIQYCNHLEKLSDGFQHLTSLQRLTIEVCAEINLDGESNQSKGLERLRFLTLREIPNLRSLSFGNSVTTLRELRIHNCHGLTSISDSISKVTSLRERTLENCRELTSISDSIGKVTSLRRLVISKCNKLKSLPKTMVDLKSLKTLIILDCALLLPRCQRETGDDWPQISHIEHIQVK